ncbi:MAG: ABC-2 family transporter protein [Bdellovibrionaceae bacterium]|nr:ABC-2 family transporter protein [Pseudobdellovibrionaceae bacterium]
MALVLKKYLRLFSILVKTSFIADLEFRVNFSLRIFTDILWYFMQILSFEILFNYTPLIGDWDRYQMRVFLGVLFIVDSLYMVFIQENADRFADKVRKGELDFILAKPVSSQFMVSFQKIATASFTNLLIAIAFFLYTVAQLEGFQWYRLFWFFLVIPTSLIVIYTSRFFFSCLNLIFVKSESVQFLWYNCYKLGLRPDSIYFPTVKLILLTVLPMSFVASVPTRMILEPPNTYLICWSLVIGPLSLYLSNIFWRYCLRFYTSASS